MKALGQGGRRVPSDEVLHGEPSEPERGWCGAVGHRGGVWLIQTERGTVRLYSGRVFRPAMNAYMYM